MNARLQALYNTIEEDNRPKFLANQVVPDTMWGKHIFGGTLQIDLSEEARDDVCKLQKDLDGLEPDNLLFLPRQYQHISFNQVVFWGGEYTLGTKETWDQCKEQFITEFTKLDQAFKSFPVTFSRLIATTGGIIWVAYDENDEMETLRNTFLHQLPFPPETTKYNHIIHTTVARFKNKMNNPKRVLDYLASYKDSVSMKVDSIILRNELIYPSIQTTELTKITLK